MAILGHLTRAAVRYFSQVRLSHYRMVRTKQHNNHFFSKHAAELSLFRHDTDMSTSKTKASSHSQTSYQSKAFTEENKDDDDKTVDDASDTKTGIIGNRFETRFYAEHNVV